MKDALKIIETLNAIAEKAVSIAEYRALVTEAVERGDLDVPVETYESASARANAFVKGEF